MTKIVFFLLVVLIPVAAHAVTLRGSYTDPAGRYVAPATYYAEKDGVRLAPSRIAFENTSTASGPNAPGKVDVVLANVTTFGHYVFQAKNSAGNWRGYDWEYAASSCAGGGSTPEEIEQYLALIHGSGPWGGIAGDGDTLVDSHSYPELLLTSTDGAVGGFTVRVFLKTDYDAGRTANSYIKARSVTLDNGHLAWGVNLNPGLEYTFVWTKQGYMTVTEEVTPHA